MARRNPSSLIPRKFGGADEAEAETEAEKGNAACQVRISKRRGKSPRE